MKLKETKIVAILAVVFVLVGSVYATDLTVPHTFSPGMTAKSSEINENFEAIYSELNALRKQIGPGPAGASCAMIHAKSGGLPSGIYSIQPDSSLQPFQVYCDMTTDGGGWTLVFLKNSVESGNYAGFAGTYNNTSVLSTTPELASKSSSAIVGWLNLNNFSYGTIRLASYSSGAQTYTSSNVYKEDLRINFGEDGYYLYNDRNGYYWCGGNKSFTDEGTGQVNRPSGAPSDCKGHGNLGSGWDFGNTSVNAGLTLCGVDGDRWMYLNYGLNMIKYGNIGAAYAIWAR